MPTYPPQRRQPVRVARGSYCSLNTNRDLLLDGEICYAEDMRAIFVAEERNGKMSLSPIRTTVQPEPAPVLRLLGLMDIQAPAPLNARDGDIVVVSVSAVADNTWFGVGGTMIDAGHQLVFDAKRAAWVDLGATVTLPGGGGGGGLLPFDLAQLPPLP